MKTLPVFLALTLLGSYHNLRSAPPETIPPVTVDAADHPTLQAALDALPGTGGLVRLPPGTFEITEPLILRTPETRLEGSGAATHIVNLNAEGQPALHIRPDDYAENKKSRLWRIQVGNLRLSGGEGSGDGILAEGINEIFLHGISIDHHGAHGINLVYCYEDPRVADCILTYNGAAGLNILGGHDIVVNANHFEENQDGVRCLDGFNLTANGNNFDDHLRHGIVIENTYGSVVSGNMIEECQGLAMLLDRDCYGITLSANVIAHDFEGGIDLRDAWGCAISANTFTIVHHFGIRAGADSGHLTITGNNFSNSYQGDGVHRRKLEDPRKEQIDSGAGVLIEGAEDIVISGNLFSGMNGKAVSLADGSEGVLLHGNLVTDFGRREAVTDPLDDPTPSGGSAQGNLVR